MLLEKKDERGEGPVVLKTGNQINASFMGTRSRSRVALETTALQASESQACKRRGCKRKRYEYYISKTRTPVALGYSVTSVKISSIQSVLEGMMRGFGSWQFTTALTAPCW